MQMPAPDEDASPELLPRTHGMAAASLMSALFCACPVVPAVGAIILGVIALGDIRDHPHEYTGQGLAVTGIVLGAAVLLIQIVVFVLVSMFGMSQDYITSTLQLAPTEALEQLGGISLGVFTQ